MKFEKLYSIKNGEWTRWSNTIADAIRDFYTVYSFYPNILEANDHTFSQFDFLANVVPNERQCVTTTDDVTGTTKLADETDDIYLSSFDFCDEADIDFAVDHHLPDKKFRLVYDDEPEWDEQEMPENCPENEFEPCLS